MFNPFSIGNHPHRQLILQIKHRRLILPTYTSRNMDTCLKTASIHRDINVLCNFLTSRRLQKPREGSGGREDSGTGRPPSFPGRPPSTRVQSGLSFGILLHRPKGSRITVQSISVWSNGPYSLEGTIKPDPLAPGDHTSFIELKLGFQFFIQVERIPLVLLVLPLVHLDPVLVHLVLVLVPLVLVLVLVSSSCNIENREREKRRAEEEPDLSDLPQHYTFAASCSFFIVLQVLQFIIPEFFNYFYLHSSYLLDSRLHQVL